MPRFDEWRITVVRQVANYGWYRERAGLGDVAEWHHSHLDVAARELELRVAEGERAAEAARATVEMVCAELD